MINHKIARVGLAVGFFLAAGVASADTLGVGPGRAVGETLAALLEEVLEEPGRNTRERLLARLAEVREARAGRRGGA